MRGRGVPCWFSDLGFGVLFGTGDWKRWYRFRFIITCVLRHIMLLIYIGVLSSWGTIYYMCPNVAARPQFTCSRAKFSIFPRHRKPTILACSKYCRPNPLALSDPYFPHREVGRLWLRIGVDTQLWVGCDWHLDIQA